MIKYIFFIALAFQLLPQNSFAQKKKSTLSALIDSKEDIKSSNVDKEFKVEVKKAKQSSMNKAKSCTTVTQNSLPHRYLLGLLRGKGARIVPSHDSSTGTLNIYGGPMVGNCNSMLDFVVREPTGDIPYALEAMIPGCGKKKCPYMVQKMENDKAVDIEKEFSPDMDGFIECLEVTGVLKEGKVVVDNITPVELDANIEDVNKTGKLVFVSKKFESIRLGGGVFSKKNLHENDNCDYYESIQKNDFIVYSKESIKHNKLMSKANKLCEDANYEDIYNNIDAFKNISGTYQALEQIMKKDLMNKVKEAKVEFDAAVKEGDLSEVDTKKYAQLFEDFYSLMVEKHFDVNSHNAADENNKDLLVNLYDDLENAETQEEKDNIEKKIRDLTKKISKYMEEPYFTPEDFKYFVSMKRKAPIKDPKWKSATLNLQKSMISLKAACQAYSVDNSGCIFSDDITDMMDIDGLNKIIARTGKSTRQLYAKKEKVLKSPNRNESDYFAKKIKSCENLLSKKNQKDMAWRQHQGQHAQSAQMYCKSKNPYVSYGGTYVKKYQRCIQDKMSDAKSRYTTSSTKLKICDQMIDRYKDQYKEWADLEGQRDDYYADDSADSDDDSDDNYEEGPYKFSYNPNPTGAPSWAQGQRPNGFIGPNQQPSYMNNYSMMNRGGGFNMNGGYGLNGGFGLNSGYGNNFMGRSPSYNGMGYGSGYGGGYGANVGLGIGYGGGMPGSMSPFMGNQTMPGGSYSFGYMR